MIRIALFVAAIAGVLSGPQDAKDQTRLIKEAVERLRSEDIRTRERATLELKKFGSAARSELEKAAGDADAEVSNRAKVLLYRLTLIETLPGRLQSLLPDIADRLAFGSDHDWTEAFLAVAMKCEDASRLPVLKRAELEFLSARAVRGASTEAERASVCEAIAGRGMKPPVPEIALVLQGPDGAPRWSVVRAVRVDPPDSVVHWLLETTREGKAWPRAAAITALGYLGTRKAVPEATRLLSDVDPIVRSRAAGALGKLRAREAAKMILPMLEVEPSAHVLDAMVELGARDAIPKIERLLNGRSELGQEALEALSDLGAKESIPRILPLLKLTDETLVNPALVTLRKLDAREAIPQVMTLLSSEEYSTRSNALYFLEVVSPKDALEHSLNLLKHPDWKTRRDAADTLGRMGDAKSITALIDRLEDEDRDVRKAAVTALGSLGASKTIPRLKELFDVERGELKPVVMVALARLGSKEIVPMVLKELRSDREEIRLGALEALGILRARQATEDVAILLKDSNANVRRQAVSTLTEIAGPEAVPHIIPLLQDKWFPVAARVVKCLAQVKAWHAKPDVARLLDDVNPYARLHAATWLALAGSTEGVPELLFDELEMAPFIVLNALRWPKLWSRLDQRSAPRLLEGTLVESVERLAREVGMDLVVEPDPLGKAKHLLQQRRRHDFGGGVVSVADALTRVLPDALSVVVEEERIRLISRNSAVEFWRAWWKETSRQEK